MCALVFNRCNKLFNAAAHMPQKQVDEDVAKVMALAEEAVSMKVEAAQCVNDAEIASTWAIEQHALTS